MFAALALAIAGQASFALELFVSLEGSDNWSGTLADPATDQSDGPLATLEAAREKLRAIRRSTGIEEPIFITLRGGTYRRTSKFLLEPEDSGTVTSPVTIRAFPGEVPVLSHAKSVVGWRPITDPLVLNRLAPNVRARVLELDLDAEGITDFGQLGRRGFGIPSTPAPIELFDHDTPMRIARYPKVGYIRAIESGLNWFKVPSSRLDNWQPSPDRWVKGFWASDWQESIEPIMAVNPVDNTVTLAPPGPLNPIMSQARVCFLNVLEELDSPGEYYVDRSNAKMYYLPTRADDITGTTISVSADPLIQSNLASKFSIRGLVLEQTRGFGLVVYSGSDIEISGCTIRSVGNTGAHLDGSRITVDSCDFRYTGESGIRLVGGDRITLTPSGSAIRNCFISDGGRWRPTYEPGIALVGVGHLVQNCEMMDLPHQAVLISGNNHIVENSFLHRVCLDTSDAGAIYMGRDWTERGNIVRDNVFREISDKVGLPNYGPLVHAVFMDDGASGITVVRNLVDRCDNAFFIGGGHDTVFRENIVIACNYALRGDARYLNWAVGGLPTLLYRLSLMPYQSPPWSSQYPELVSMAAGNPAIPSGNEFAMNLVEASTPFYLADGTDQLFLIERNFYGPDLQFLDRELDNLKLKKGSPPARAGFPKIQNARAGLMLNSIRTTRTLHPIINPAD